MPPSCSRSRLDFHSLSLSSLSGTNFVARSAALHGVDYFPTESITEDYLLSLKLATAGWTVRFHPACVCTGEAPEDLRQVFKQRNRCVRAAPRPQRRAPAILFYVFALLRLTCFL